MVISERATRAQLRWILVLHVAPGALFLAAFVPLAVLADSRGLPATLGAYAADLLVLLPVLLGVMWWWAREREPGRPLIAYRTRLPARRYLLLAGLTLTWAVVVFAVIDPSLSGPLREGVFSWVPEWFDLGRQVAGADELTAGGLVASWAAGLVVGSLLVPVVEELYFRGFLLPRLAPLGAWAPVVNTVLFAVYHLAQPWLVPTRVLATLPLYFAVWRTRSVYLGIGVHVALNLVGDSLLTAPAVFG